MRPRFRPLAVASLVLAASLPSAAFASASGLSANAAGAAGADIVAPLVVVREADLDFGAIFATTAPGTVVVAPGTNAAAYTGGVSPACAPGACSGTHSARFSVTGEPNRAYAITLPAAVVAHGATADGSAAPPLDVAALNARSASRPDSGPSGMLDPAGHDRFEVGATLAVPSGVPAANYRAVVAVIVAYS